MIVKKSIVDLLTNYYIYIPAIQREYVQGSKYTDSNINIPIIRGRLIEDIIQSLENEIPLSLGIISVNSEENNEKIYVLDGQQRLTTLFLFYWTLCVKSNNFDYLKIIKGFNYEIRDSSDLFIKFLLNSNYNEDFKQLLCNNNFHNEIKNNQNFKIKWLKDVTVLAMLNTIDEINKKLSEKKDINKYVQIIANFNYIHFHLSIECNKDAYLASCQKYITLNSRGKELDFFDNLKARLEIIENKSCEHKNKENLFVYKYDLKYIDLFYNRCLDEQNLIEKTNKINEQTINTIINLYNIFLYFIKIENNKNNSYNFKKNKQEFMDFIYKISRKELLKENLEFFKEYFQFLNIIIDSINEQQYKNLIKLDYIFYNILNFEHENFYELIINIIYIYYYSKNNKKYPTDNILKQLNYILENLKFYEWNVCENDNLLNFQYKFIIKLSEYENIYEYFIENNFEDNIDYYSKIILPYIKVRFKEQHIKCNIIKNYNLDEFYFEELVRRNNTRLIHYLLFICDLWDDKIEDDKINLLNEYIKIANKYFYNNNLEWKKILAIVENTNETFELLSVDEINQNLNKTFENQNIWFWNDKYYYVEDININLKKINSLKKAYKFINNLKYYNNDVITWAKINFNENYNNCWLKYAIDKDIPELFYSHIKFQNGPKIYYGASYVNFYSRIFYYLLKSQENIKTEVYSCSLYNINTNPIKYWDITYSKGIDINELNNNFKILNQFESNIIIQSNIKEKYIENNIIRSFLFYYLNIDISDFIFDEYKNIIQDFENIIFIFSNKNIKIYKFVDNNYILYTLNLEEVYKLKFNLEENFNKVVNEIEFVNQIEYSDNINITLGKYNMVARLYKRQYNYNNQTILKCKFIIDKNSLNIKKQAIEMSDYGTIKFDNLN